MSASLSLKKPPYGIFNFADIRQSSLAYVDKTQFIEALENCGLCYSVLVRPRCFGKTLATSMMKAYYDEAAAGQFESTFAGTYIGAHKTPLASKFRVLHLDLSGLTSPKHDDREESLLNTVRTALCDYFRRYPQTDQDEILKGNFTSAADLISRFFSYISRADGESFVYVLIDGYDQFVNDLFSEDATSAVVPDPAPLFLRNFFTRLKSATTDAVARIFITSVTFISLDSLSSGFNIAANCTTYPALADIYGFTEAELRDLAPQLVDLDALGLSLDNLIARMKEWYSGYRFSRQNDTTVFNPAMCLNYLRSLQQNGREPTSLLDSNLGQDLRKLESILQLGDADFVQQTVELALRREPIPFSGVLRTVELNSESKFSRETLLSVLFYLGFLTYATGKKRELVIPNRAVSVPFFEYFLKHILNADKHAFSAAGFNKALKALIDGAPKPLFDFTFNRFQFTSDLHSHAYLRESDFQTLLIGALNFTNAYTVTSEVEVRDEEKGCIDILATPSAESRATTSYLIEVKYLTPKAATDEAKEQVLAQAWEQISRCEKDDNVKNLPKLTRIAALFVGLKLETLEIR